MNQGVHTVDLLRWFLGSPVDVQAHTGLLAHERLEVEDTAVAIVRFDSGALAVLHATTAAYPGLTVRIQVHGSLSSAIIDNDRLEYFHAAEVAGEGNSADGAGGVAGGDVTGNSAEAEVGFVETTAAPIRDDIFVLAHSRQYDDIAHSIDTGAAPCASVHGALLSLAVVRALYLSSTLERRIAHERGADADYAESDDQSRTQALRCRLPHVPAGLTTGGLAPPKAAHPIELAMGHRDRERLRQDRRDTGTW